MAQTNQQNDKSVKFNIRHIDKFNGQPLNERKVPFDGKSVVFILTHKGNSKKSENAEGTVTITPMRRLVYMPPLVFLKTFQKSFIADGLFPKSEVANFEMLMKFIFSLTEDKIKQTKLVRDQKRKAQDDEQEKKIEAAYVNKYSNLRLHTNDVIVKIDDILHVPDMTAELKSVIEDRKNSEKLASMSELQKRRLEMIKPYKAYFDKLDPKVNPNILDKIGDDEFQSLFEALVKVKLETK